MILSLVYPIILGLDRLETASLLRSNGTFQYLTGLPSYPSPQSLRRIAAAKLITMITGTATKGRSLSSATVKKAGP
jgi:hypothetical protein